MIVSVALWGAFVAWHYHAAGLTLSHYDAKGHLVVARRIFDSLTPGWKQIGAVWLPLPHLLNMLPVQIDLFYRTGASGVAISVVEFRRRLLGGVPHRGTRDGLGAGGAACRPACSRSTRTCSTCRRRR